MLKRTVDEQFLKVEQLAFWPKFQSMQFQLI